jgi:uncharacterized protein (TIGR02145 family)
MPDGRWWMAQNLNYQKDLTWLEYTKNPSTVTGSDTALIGHFWCPGGFFVTPKRESCAVWGALYSFATAMMVDGKWSNDNRNTTTWSDSPIDEINNGGKGAGGHGICPPNWHVPTDAEWGNMLNAIETGEKNHNTGANYIGTNAGKFAKATCTCPIGSDCVDDNNARWWYNAGIEGEDVYGFRVLPTGRRLGDDNFGYRGDMTIFWSSSASGSPAAWVRLFASSENKAGRHTNKRSGGYSVRCIRNK